MSIPIIEGETPTESSERERAEPPPGPQAQPAESPEIVQDRRKHRRVVVSIFGRFMREDKQEYPCHIINMSAGGMAMLVPDALRSATSVSWPISTISAALKALSRDVFEGGLGVRILASARQARAHRQSLDLARQSEELGPRRRAEARTR